MKTGSLCTGLLNGVHSSLGNTGSMGWTVAPFTYLTSDRWVQNVELDQCFFWKLSNLSVALRLLQSKVNAVSDYI